MSESFSTYRTTFSEFGDLHIENIAGEYPTREDAFFAAMEAADEFAGPIEDGYRRPTVQVVRGHDGNLAVQVGTADADGAYTIFAVEQQSWNHEVPAIEGRGYVACKL